MKASNREILSYLRRLDHEAAVKEAAKAARHARRVAKGTQAKPRPVCRCQAYPWPHRPAGGLCRYPEPPIATFGGKGGKTAPVGMRKRSAIRRRLMKQYGFHPIRDRERIRRWLPKLYAAHSRRFGYPWAYWWLGGYVPAMLVTASGRPPGLEPDNSPEFWAALLAGTSRKHASRRQTKK